MGNGLDIVAVLQKNLQGKQFQIQKDMLGTATVQVEAGAHKDAIKA